MMSMTLLYRIHDVLADRTSDEDLLPGYQVSSPIAAGYLVTTPALNPAGATREMRRVLYDGTK